MAHMVTWWRDGDDLINLNQCVSITRVTTTVNFNLPTVLTKTFASEALAISYYESVMIFIHENKVINL